MKYVEILTVESYGEKFAVSFKINTLHPNLTPEQRAKILKALGKVADKLRFVI